ncbi:hypothetical protein J7E73_01605 [Paenibacillus albidus]|uniref:hypothetical protein n=1 Tax=Paenibacillus albidus TaxID=2041023 RepID=UPI001BED3073|nr:hypothetical protein [Paenibacillus albidus]MBT2287841.1 hypothetical protein [Paenibacillus albidus]
MKQKVQELSEWLNTHVNATIVIEKQELDDADKVHFQLEAVDYRDAEDVLDDYLDSALILRGSGSTMNDGGESVPLPQASYEIAVSGLELNAKNDNKLEIKTDRATYVLSLV